TSSIIVNSAGTYLVTVTNNNGCTGTTSATITVNANPIPVITASGPTSFCAGDSVVLNAGSYSSYIWNNGATTQNITESTSGLYSATVTDANGCTGGASATITVNQNPTPIITTNGPNAICSGDSVALNAGTYASFHWNNGASTQSIFANTAGTYHVTVTTINGCTGTASISISVNPNPTPSITVIGHINFCYGDSIILETGNFPYYSWSNGGNSQSIYVHTTNQYKVTVTNSFGCTGTDSIIVSAGPFFLPNISPI